MAGRQGETRDRAPARVLSVPPPGGPPTAYRRVAAPGRRPDDRHRHRRRRTRLTPRGWLVLRVTVGLLLTTVTVVTWDLAGHRTGSAAPAAQAAVSAEAATRPRVTAPPPPAVGPDGVPVAVARAVAAAGGDVSVAVFDATTGRSWASHDALKVEASVSKLQLLGAELRSLGTAAPEGTVETALREMIENSDNDAADVIFDRVGRSGLQAFDSAVGATGVVADPHGEFGLDTSTAVDEVAVMKALAYGNAVLSDAARDRADDLLADVESDQRWGATGGVPAGAQVRVKDGWLPVDGAGWAVDSVAHVSGDGRDYVVALMSSGNATEQAGIDRLTAVSAAVWASAGTG